MKYILDTQLLLWAAGNSRSLPRKVRRLLDDDSIQPVFSAASIWEIVIKNGLGRTDFETDPRILRRQLLENGYVELGITSEHALGVERLPPLHKDPFDRILIAQSMVEGIILLTCDPVMAQYPAPIQHC